MDRLYFGLKLNVFTHKLRLDRILDKLVHLRFWFFAGHIVSDLDNIQIRFIKKLKNNKDFMMRSSAR